MKINIDGNVLFQYKDNTGTDIDDVIMKVEAHWTNFQGEKSILVNIFVYWNNPETMEFYEEIKITKNFILSSNALIDVINSAFQFINVSSDFTLSATDSNDKINEFAKKISDLYL